jgi:hypothetical protein
MRELFLELPVPAEKKDTEMFATSTIGSSEDFDRVLEILNVTYETLDFASGLQSNYSNKVIGTSPVRGLGRVSFGAILQSLGLAILVVEDAEALARVQKRLTRRRRPQSRRAEHQEQIAV